MPQNYKKQITIAEITCLIRQEAAQNKTADCGLDLNMALPDLDALSQLQLRRETVIWKLIKKIQYAFRIFPFYCSIYRIAIKYRDYIPRYRNN
jgi:hypothetical protein